MASESVEILLHLSRLRRSIRTRLGCYGALTVLAGGCLSLLTILAVDWLLELPPLLRVFGAVLFVLGFGFASLHWIVRPLQKPLSLTQVAGRLERHFGGMDDRLTSAVDFLTHGQAASVELMRQVIVNTNRVLNVLPIRSVLTSRPLLIQGGLLILGVTALWGTAFVAPQWLRTGLVRYAQPFAGVDWPHNVRIVSETHRVKVPLGESTDLRMRVTRGDRPHLRGVVHLVDARGEKSELAMHRDRDGTFRCTIDALSNDLTFWFEAGDDDTRRTPGLIQVISRPAVTEFVARVGPPDYAVSKTVAEFDLRAGPAVGVIGSSVELRVRSSKPLLRDEQGRARLELAYADGAEETLPLKPIPNESRTLRAVTKLRSDTTIRVFIADADGFTNHSGQGYELSVSPDDAPNVTLIQPTSTVETTASGALRLRATVKDDFGVSGVRLIATDESGDEIWRASLMDSDTSSPGNRRTTIDVDYTWPVAKLGLASPATVRYRVEAADDFAIGDVRGQVGASAWMLLKIIGQDEFESLSHDTLVTLGRRLRQILFRQQEMVESTRRIDSARAAGHDRGRSIIDMARRQSRLGRSVEELSQRFADVEERLRLNGVSDAAWIATVDRVRADLAGPAAGASSEAAELLRRAAELEADPAVNLTEAMNAQTGVATTLSKALSRLDEWGDFRVVVNKTRDLMDRQTQLREATASTASGTVGRSIDELNETERAALARIELRQQRLREEFDALVARMSRTGMRDGAAESAAMGRAAREAAAHEIAQRMQKAGAAVRQNRLAGAGLEQEQIVRGLGKMVGALQEQEMRRLAELAKKLERADRAVAELLGAEEELVTVTAEADAVKADDAVYTNLSQDQSRVRRNADGILTDLLQEREAAEAADRVAQAAREMRDAAGALADVNGVLAVEFEQEAVRLLREAYEVLAEQARRAGQQAFRARMEHIRGRLSAIHHDQQEVRDTTGDVLVALSETRRLRRADARRVSKLALRQREILAEADDVAKDVSDSIVYAATLTQVLRGMRASETAFRARRLDDELRTTQDDVLRRLSQLIEALRTAAELPPTDEFVASGGGGSGGQSSKNGPPIPTAAELIMLKTMQMGVMADTAALDASRRASTGTPTEAELTAAERLGVRQREVRLLTRAVVEKAREGQR